MGFRRHAKHCQLGIANDLCRLLNRLGTAWMLREPLAVRLPASAQAWVKRYMEGMKFCKVANNAFWHLSTPLWVSDFEYKLLWFAILSSHRPQLAS